MQSIELFDLARRFTVARLLERDDFTKRMAAREPISALELLYPVLQGYDSVAIEADVELGGTDQKFNLLFGRDVQESFGKPAQSVMTMPILPGTDGKRRMSKSLGNYVGVSEAPAEIFGKLMSVPDEAMAGYWTLLLGEELDTERHQGKAKRELARRLVDRFAGGRGGAVAEARFDEIHVAARFPTTSGDRAGLPDTMHVPALIADAFGVSRGEARRMIAQGAVRIDGEPLAADSLDLQRGGSVERPSGRQAPLRPDRRLRLSPAPETGSTFFLGTPILSRRLPGRAGQAEGITFCGAGAVFEN